MAPLDINPNELEPYWVPFTPNRAFKKRPRIFSGAKGMHYFKPDGTKVTDATSGLFCVNAGHCREPIVKAIQEMAAKLDYSPAFQYGHPKVFELASRLSLLAPGDPLSEATGVDNVIEVQASVAGRLIWRGPGAGGRATASALLADTVAAARIILQS